MAATSLAPAPSSTITEQRFSRAQRILVIAENRALQRTLQRLFCSEGYEVEIVADDLDGLEMLRNRPPSALILDLRYPGSGRWELCREIAQSAPDIPFVVLSAKADVVDKIVLLEMGADDHMVVPFQPRELVARLRSLIRRAAGAREKFDRAAFWFSTSSRMHDISISSAFAALVSAIEFLTASGNQHFYYQRVAPGVETTVWYEESGALVHITWYLETQTTHRFAALPAWLAEDMTV